MRLSKKMKKDPFLEDKKSRFLIAVKDSAEFLGAKTPKVKFWSYKELDHFDGNERAHIHTDTNTICIAETELENMTYEDIEETASHEVSHLIELSHNPKFQGIKQETKTGIWRPPWHYYTKFSKDPREILAERAKEKTKYKLETKPLKHEKEEDLVKVVLKRVKEKHEKEPSFWDKIRRFFKRKKS